jgi:D-amino-acid dehydrogenase
MIDPTALPAAEPVPEALRRSVVVVGAGFVGLSSALWLQRRGHRVVIVDRNPPLEGADYRHACSYGNAACIALNACLPVAGPGILRQLPRMLVDRGSPLSISWRDLPSLLPWLVHFLRASSPEQADRGAAILGRLIRLAESGHAPLMAECGLAALKRPAGTLHLFRDEQSFQSALPDIRRREEQGVRFELLDAAAVHEREPNLAPCYRRGVLYLDSYGIDDPLAYAVGLGKAFLARGGRFITGRARDLVRREEGVEIVVDGVSRPADRIVIAAGAWSAKLAATVGDHVPLSTERGYHVLFPDGEKLLSTPTMYPEHGFYMTPLSEGLRAAGTVELGGLDRPHRPERCAIIAAKTRRFLPGLGEHTREWRGFRPSMPDSLPVIGPSPCDPRVVYAFGHGHVGLTLAGITGRIVADIVSARQTPVDITPLKPDRFDRAKRF